MEWLVIDQQPLENFICQNLHIRNIPNVNLEKVQVEKFRIENVTEVLMDEPIPTDSLIPSLIVKKDINQYNGIKFREILVKSRRTYWENPLPYYKFQTLKDSFKIIDTSENIQKGISVEVIKTIAVWDFDDSNLYQYTPLEWMYNFHDHYNFEILKVSNGQVILPEGVKLPKAKKPRIKKG
jgi:hypothetical protein